MERSNECRHKCRIKRTPIYRLYSIIESEQDLICYKCGHKAVKYVLNPNAEVVGISGKEIHEAEGTTALLNVVKDFMDDYP